LTQSGAQRRQPQRPRRVGIERTDFAQPGRATLDGAAEHLEVLEALDGVGVGKRERVTLGCNRLDDSGLLAIGVVLGHGDAGALVTQPLRARAIPATEHATHCFAAWNQSIRTALGHSHGSALAGDLNGTLDHALAGGLGGGGDQCAQQQQA